MKWTAAVFALLAPCTAPAYAEQCAEFSLANVSSSTAAYNPFDPYDAASDLVVLVRRANASATQVRFLLADPTPGSVGPELGFGGPAQYHIQWLDDATRRILAAPGEEPTAFRAVVAQFEGANDTAIEPLRLIIPRGQLMAPGGAEQPLDILFECVSAGGDVVERGMQPSRIRIRARHTPNFAIYIAGLESRYGVLDLGALDIDAASTAGRLGVAVLSSLPYEMRVSSENDFSLRREDGAGNDRLPYNLTIDGVAVDELRVLNCPVTPPPNGQTLDVGVAVPGPLREHRAGAYRDVITLSFSARDFGATGSHCVRS